MRVSSIFSHFQVSILPRSPHSGKSSQSRSSMSTAADDSSSDNLQVESISFVDLQLLSQSELQSLSLCSENAFDLRRCDEVVIPKIDRSVFNESAGSRKQTYSRLRLAPRKPEISTIGRRRRCPGLLPIPKPPTNPIDDPERKENKRIVSILKELFARENIPIEGDNGRELFPEPLNIDNGGLGLQKMPIVAVDGERKRKRGRKPKNVSKPNVEGDGIDLSKAMVVYESESKLEVMSMEIVNRNGVVVDVAALANVEDPFGTELERRTVGLETEAQLLEFLRGLNGHWGSRRKKRKIVDASDFGDVLPKGWKLLLSLKRKEGRVSLYCRRYISPNGQQFVSCKDVSSYLLSFWELQEASQSNSGHGIENIQQASKLGSGTTAGLNYKEESRKDDLMCHSVSPIASVSNDRENHMDLLGIENLAEVQIRDLLECHKCNMTFDEKEAYLQRLLSSHQRAPKRLRLGTSICDGVIVKDGKFECQFCHKIFDERHRYNGHVGVHVRNFVRSNEALPGEMTLQRSIEPSSLGGVPLSVSKMDAPVDVDKVSTPATSAKPYNNEQDAGSSHWKIETHSSPEIPSAKSNDGQNVGPHTEVDVVDINRGSIRANSSEPYDEPDTGSPHCKMDMEISPGILPPTISPKINSKEPDVGSSHSKIETYASPEVDVDDINKGSIRANSSEPYDEPDTGSPHCKIDMEISPGILPPTISPEINSKEADSGSSHSKIETCASPEIPFVKLYLEQNFDSYTELEAVDNNKGSISANSAKRDDEPDTGSPHCKMELGPDPGSFTPATFAKTNNEELDAESHNKNETHDSPEIPIVKSKHVQNICLHTKVDAVDINKGSIRANYSTPSNETDAGSLHYKTDMVAGPKILTAEFNHGDNFCTPCSEQNMEANKIYEALVDDSCDQHCMSYKMIDAKADKINEANNIVGVESGSCLNPETPVTDNGKIVPSDTLDGKDVLTGATNDIDKSELKQERSIENCSVFPSENNQFFSIEKNMNDDFTYIKEDPKLDDAEKTRNIELESCFGSSHAGPNVNVLAETAQTIDEENILQSGIAEFSSLEDSKFEHAEKMRNELKTCFGSGHAEPDVSVIAETAQRTDEVNVLRSGIADSSSPVVLSLACFPTFNMMSEKGEDEFCSVNQKLDTLSGFEELKLDDIEPPTFDFLTGQDSSSVPEVSMELEYVVEMDQRIDSSIPFEWQSTLPRIAAGHQLTTVCVWCRMEFNVDAVTSETQPDSVGFMCPTCKANISGQLNVLDNGLSMNSHQL